MGVGQGGGVDAGGAVMAFFAFLFIFFAFFNRPADGWSLLSFFFFV